MEKLEGQRWFKKFSMDPNTFLYFMPDLLNQSFSFPHVKNFDNDTKTFKFRIRQGITSMYFKAASLPQENS